MSGRSRIIGYSEQGACAVRERGTVNHRGRWVSDAPVNEPFYTHGDKAWRNGHALPCRGWFLVDDDGDLHGPFKSKADAMHARSTRTP